MIEESTKSLRMPIINLRMNLRFLNLCKKLAEGAPIFHAFKLDQIQITKYFIIRKCGSMPIKTKKNCLTKLSKGRKPTNYLPI